MAKAMKNPSRREARLLETRRALVEQALEAGITTRKGICKAANLALHDLTNLFTKDRELYAKFVIRRRTMVDVASDNLQEILEDKNHPQNFQATKYVLQTYKSDLDDILDSNGDELSVEIPTSNNSDDNYTPIMIKFSSKRRDKEVEE